MQILALDVGVSEVRAAVVDVAVQNIAGSIIMGKCEIRRPSADAAEVVPSDLWACIRSTARQACRDFPDVKGVGLSVRTPSLVLLDKADHTLGAIWTAEDRRARPAARQVWAGVGNEFLTATGRRPLPGLTSAIQFRQRHSDDPYLSHNVRSYLHLNGWLAFHMTGERACDGGTASCSGLFGTLNDRRWSGKWCDFFEVEPEWLPPVVEANAAVGTIRSAAAAELGVTAGIPLKLGLLDPAGAVFGSQMTCDDLLHDVGTIQSLTAISPVAGGPPKSSDRVETRLLGIGDGYIQTAYNPVGSAAVTWLREVCFRDQDDATFLGATMSAALKRSPRVVLDPPFLAGDTLEIEAHRGAFRDLTLNCDRLDLLAAMIQAMRRGHKEAAESLGLGRVWQRILFSGEGVNLVRPLLPNYDKLHAQTLSDLALHGVIRLFAGC